MAAARKAVLERLESSGMVLEGTNGHLNTATWPEMMSFAFSVSQGFGERSTEQLGVAMSSDVVFCSLAGEWLLGQQGEAWGHRPGCCDRRLGTLSGDVGLGGECGP